MRISEIEKAIRAYDQGDGATLQHMRLKIRGMLAELTQFKFKGLLLYQVGDDGNELTYWVSAHTDAEAYFIVAKHMLNQKYDDSIITAMVEEVTLRDAKTADDLIFVNEDGDDGTIWGQFCKVKEPSIVAYPMEEL